MDVAMARTHLAMAEQHVALGDRHIFRQREIIEELERGRHDALAAHRLLGLFEDMQMLHVQYRDRLRRKLGAQG
jgi:hypothetical protein